MIHNHPNRLLVAVGFCLGLTAAPLAIAQTSDDGGARFSRLVTVQKPGPQRLAVDLELLAGAQPTLADVRLFDAGMREIAYLLVLPATTEPEWQDAVYLQATVNEKGRSGFELDLGKLLPIDRVRVLDLAPPVLKRLRLEASGERTRYSLLADDVTVFDLPEEGLRRMDVDIAAGSYRYLRFIWDDRDTPKVGLPRRVSVRLVGSGGGAKSAPEIVPFEARPSRAALSQWRITLPAKHLPITALLLETEQPRVMRFARVSESRLSSGGLAAVVLGSATLRRALRSGLFASDLRIPIQRPETSELILSVENGSDPPLAVGRIYVELAPQPWFYFEARQSGTITMRYGAKKMSAPHYDLEAERENAQRSELAEARWASPAQPRSASTGDLPSTTPSVALLHGSALEPEQFGYSRSIIDPGGAMTSLRLDAAVLAHSNALEDLRILDQHNRQIPYLFELEAEPLVLELATKVLSGTAKPKGFDAHHSVYQVTLPYSNLPAGQLALRTSSRVFRRQVAVHVAQPQRPGKSLETRAIAEASWVHADEGRPPPPLEFAVAAGTDPNLYLIIEDGDNAPLPVLGCQLLLPGRRMRFYHVKGDDLTLHYGAPALPGPRYDFALLSQELEQLPLREGGLGAERARPEVATGAAQQAKWFWGVMVLTVLSLVALIARLVRRS